MEGRRICHLVDCSVQCVDDRRSQRKRHIANPKPNNFLIRICLRKCIYFFCNVGKQIASRKLQVILVDFKHKFLLFYTFQT